MTESKLAPEQVEVLYASYAARLQRFLLGVLRDRELVEEVLQRTFLQVLEKGHTAAGETMKGWIYKVAFNQAMALRRRVGRRPWQEALDPDLLVPATASRNPVVEEVVADEALRGAESALAELPTAQREVLRMRFVDSMTFPQIATQLGVPLGTALTRMRLALEKLRRRLQ